MSTSSLSVNSSNGSLLSVSGLASGLDTSSIVAALMSSEREPVTRLSDEQTRLHGQQQQLQTIQSTLEQLNYALAEFTLPSTFASNQSVTSSEPSLIAAAASGGSGVGGYEVEVTQLARSAQRTYTFTSPAAEGQLTIGGRQYTVAAGETAQQLASAINSDPEGAVYAATLEGSQIVLSSRATGEHAGEAIQVSSPEETLVEVAGSAREGKDAEFSVDGVSGSSASNTVTDAIAGVTLTLTGLTEGAPVTIDVGAPGPSVSALEGQLQSFVKLYNGAVETIEKQLATRPPQGTGSSELESGTLYADQELTSLLTSAREIVYEPVAGVSGQVTSLAQIGISTGAPTGAGATSQASLEGVLKFEPAKLAQAVQTDPAGVQELLQKWSLKLQGLLTGAAEPGGAIETRLKSDESQYSELAQQISSMNEILAQREKALQATYAQLESVISVNDAQSSWLTNQEKAFASG